MISKSNSLVNHSIKGEAFISFMTLLLVKKIVIFTKDAYRSTMPGCFVIDHIILEDAFFLMI